MDKDFVELCEKIDASCFSGDTLYNELMLQEFKWYVERWMRIIKEYEIMENPPPISKE